MYFENDIFNFYDLYNNVFGVTVLKHENDLRTIYLLLKIIKFYCIFLAVTNLLIKNFWFLHVGIGD